MIRGLRPRRAIMFVTLVLVWCGLWREVSFANVAAGAAIATAVTVTGVGPPNRGGLRLRPLLHFIGLVLIDLAKSTANVAVEIITPVDHTDEAIIMVEVPPPGRDHLLLLSVAITLTPGTAVVDADPETGALYLHLLYHEQREETVAHVHELVRLACAALPTRPMGAST